MKNSFSNKNWKILYKNTEENEFLVQRLICSLCVPEIVAQIMVNRGIVDMDEAENFLDAKLKNIMPDPSTFLDMDVGINRVATAILESQKIFVFGDYDVDGVTSTCLLVSYLREIGINPEYKIPHRVNDGYGLNANAFKNAAESGTDLFIVVDSGVSAVDEISFGNGLGIDTIVIDHHMPSESLPEAIAVINPNRKDQPDVGAARIRNMSAAGVVFMFLVGLQRHLRAKGFFKTQQEPNLKDMLGVVALGTVCDVMEIRGINRAFVNFALKNQRFTTGVKALMCASGIESVSSSDDFAFTLGPAINAAGRLGDAVSAIEMMLSSKKVEAERFANELVRLNATRKEIEKQVFEAALHFINKNALSENKAIFVYGNRWQEGVIGIIAGKLKDKFGRPVFVATFDENGNGKGSARSVPGVSIFDIISEAKRNDIISKGGGHELAGGFSMHISSANRFSDFLNQNITTDPMNILYIDCVVPNVINFHTLAKEINILEPFGKGVGRPIFCMQKVQLERLSETQDGNHMMIFISCPLGETMKCMLFNIKTKENLVRSLKNIDNELVDLAFFVTSNKKYGHSIIVEDIKLAF